MSLPVRAHHPRVWALFVMSGNQLCPLTPLFVMSGDQLCPREARNGRRGGGWGGGPGAAGRRGGGRRGLQTIGRAADCRDPVQQRGEAHLL